MTRLDLQFPGPFLQRALQRIVDLVAVTLSSMDGTTPRELKIPGVFMQVNPAHKDRLPATSLGDEAVAWCLANALRDCVEALGPALEWTRRHCVIWNQPGGIASLSNERMTLDARMTGEIWNREIVSEGRKFERLSLHRKLDYLEAKFGLEKPGLTSAVMSINAARNCLTHRQGVVGPADLHGDMTSLSVQWRKVEIVRGQPDGSKTPIVGPMNVKKGDTIEVGLVDVRRDFSVGKRIQFSAEEFVELSTTFLLFASELQDVTTKMQRRIAVNRSSGPAGVG